MSKASEVADVTLKTTLTVVTVMGGVLIYNTNSSVNKINHIADKVDKQGAIAVLVGDEKINQFNKNGIAPFIVGEEAAEKINEKGLGPAIFGDKIADEIAAKGALAVFLGPEMANKVNKDGMLAFFLGHELNNEIKRQGFAKVLLGNKGISGTLGGVGFSVRPKPPMERGFFGRLQDNTLRAYNAVVGVWHSIFGSPETPQPAIVEQGNIQTPLVQSPTVIVETAK